MERPLSDVEKGLCQLLMSHGLLSEDELMQYLPVLNKYNNTNTNSANNDSRSSSTVTSLPLAQYFANINRRIRNLSLEIKSVNHVGSGGRRVLLHGLVNIEEDAVAKKWGQ
jgi:hypothetical protein